jgi:quinol monooxygenase YgiN
VAKPEHKEAVQQLCKEVTEFSTARMKERSNGIQEFNCMVDGWQDNVVHFWERYDSNVMLGRHNTTPEVETFMNKVVPLLEQPIGMALYEYRNGQIGPPSMQMGPKGEGGLDDATGASGAAGGASYKQTSRATQLATVVTEDDAPSRNGSSSSSSSSAPQSQQPGSSDAAWWSWAGSQPAAVAAVVGAAAVLAVVALKLTGH